MLKLTRLCPIGTLLATMFATVLLLGAISPSDPFAIDVVLPITGNQAFSGETHATALHAYESVANASGGIRGRPIHFEIHDDQSNPVVAVQLTNQILAKNPSAIIGSGYIAACAAQAPLVKTAIQFCVSPGLITHQRNIFASSVPVTTIVPSLYKFLRERGYTRVGVISSTDATGQLSDQLTNAAFAQPDNKTLKLVAFEHFNPTDISVSAQIARLKTSNPQALAVYATGSGFATVLRALHDAGIDIPVLTSAVNMNEAQLDEYRSFLPAELIFNTVLYVAPDAVRDRSLRRAIAEFYDGYRRIGATPSPASGLSWDPAKIVVAAYRALGTDATGLQIADWINNLHGFAGASGIYDFRSGDHHGLGPDALIFVKWVAATKTFTPVAKPGGSPTR